MANLFLPQGLLQHVIEFLDPRSLFNIAFLGKETQDCLTHDMVVKSALYHGGYPKKTISSLVDLARTGAIHPPSPARCLRLVNGIRCESCLTNVSNHIREGYGLFICWHCCTKRRMSKAVIKDGPVFDKDKEIITAILDHPSVSNKTYAWRNVRGGGDVIEEETIRANNLGLAYTWGFGRLNDHDELWGTVFQVQDKRNYMWKRPRNDRLGERVGTVVTYEDVSKIITHLKCSPGSTSTTKEITRLIDGYLKDVLNAPDQKLYVKLVESFENSIQGARSHLKDIEWKKKTLSAKWKAKKLV